MIARVRVNSLELREVFLVEIKQQLSRNNWNRCPIPRQNPSMTWMPIKPTLHRLHYVQKSPEETYKQNYTKKTAQFFRRTSSRDVEHPSYHYINTSTSTSTPFAQSKRYNHHGNYVIIHLFIFFFFANDQSMSCE